MDYIKFAIDELEKQNEKRGITAGMARQQYSALLSRIAQLEAAQQGVQADKCPDCDGTSVVLGGFEGEPVDCPACKGTGICR